MELKKEIETIMADPYEKNFLELVGQQNPKPPVCGEGEVR